jgi:hypothetical protein
MRFSVAKYLSRFVTRRPDLRPPSRWGDVHQKPVLEPLEDRLLLSILFSSSGSRNVADSGGNVIQTPDVDLVFWGSGWTRGSGPTLRTNLTTAVNNIMNSPYLSDGSRGDGLTQYRGVGRTDHFYSSQVITSTDPPNRFTDAQVDQMLQANISNLAVSDFRHDDQILYLVVPQPDCVNVDPSIWGEHDSDRLGFLGPRFHYGWTINGGSNGESVDFLTDVLSHELVEAATDPESNFPNATAFWVPSTHDEIGDGEAQSYSYRVFGALVQSYLSQNRHAYIVPTGQNQDFFVNSGTLTINGDQLANRDDTITVSTQGGGVRVTLNGETAQFEPGVIRSIIINPGTGDDRVTIGSTPAGVPVTVNLGSGYDTVTVGTPILNNASSVTVNGQPGGHATLAVDDSGTPTSETYTVTDSSVSRTSGGVFPVYYRNILNLVLDVGTATETVNVLSTNAGTTTSIYGGRGTNTVTVGAPGLYNHGPLVIDGQGGNCTLNINDQPDAIAQTYTITGTTLTRTGTADANTISYSHIANLVLNVGYGVETINVPSTSLVTTTTVNGAGIDVVNVQGTGGPLVFNAQGGGGNDVMNLGLNNSLRFIGGAVTISNGGGLVHLNVNDSADPLNLAATINSGGMTGLAPANIYFTSSSVNTLVYNGGYGNNSYKVAATPAAASVTLNTGPGTDTVTVQRTGALVTVNSAGGSGHDTIILGESTNTLDYLTGEVRVNAAATDTLVLNDQGTARARTYQVFPNYVFWAGHDVFFSGLRSVTINGSAGSTFDLSAGTSTAAAVILNGLGNSSLTASNAGNFWEITGADTGILSGSAYPKPVAFNQVGSLKAGTGGDYFLFDDGATLSGNLAGGSDTLDYSPYSTTVIVDLQTGIATGVAGSVSGIVNVVGGSAGPADSSAYNLLIGNGGNTLTGGDGRRNILVAGGSASTLIGGNGDDLLIGGTTSYDGDPTLASWLQIADYWAGPNDYSTRVGNLTSGNGVPLLDATTVTNNGGGNTLLGHGGGVGELNLYYGLDPSQENTDYDPSIGEQFINV